MFAKANDVKPALFSPNSAGACPTCSGQGVIYTDLAMMAGVATTCPECEGRRFLPEVLTYRLDGHTIADVLNMTGERAAEVFTSGKPKKILATLIDVGLGYLRLGQPLSTLSGGERQRINTTSLSWRRPITSSTSAPAPDMTAARSSSPARRVSSRPPRPSPARRFRPTARARRCRHRAR